MTSGTPGVGAVVLAAGGSTRMRGPNKLLEPVEGTPMVAQVVDRILSVGVTPVVVVMGHEGHRVADSLADRPITPVQNPRWMEGMSTSIATGLAALEGRVQGALICLGDMPRVSASDLTGLIEAFRASSARDPSRAQSDAIAAWVPVHEDQRGNPVLWAASWFPTLGALQGDRGAKGLLSELGDRVVEVPAGAGVLFDVDTPDELKRAREAEGD